MFQQIEVFKMPLLLLSKGEKNKLLIVEKMARYIFGKNNVEVFDKERSKMWQYC